MAIQKVKRAATDKNGYPSSYENVGEPEYVGQVVSLHTSYDVRKMSDIWADDFYAIVWTGTGTTSIFLGSNFELQDTVARATVDATPEVLAAYAAWGTEQARVAAENQRRQAKVQANEAAQTRLLAPVKGYPARVIKGRKVPVGTEGTITWEGDSAYGWRVGIRDAAGTVHYTAISNVIRTGTEPLPGEDWTGAERRLTVVIPSKWDSVLLSDGTEGTVFYVSGARLGVATTNRKVGGKYVDVVWTTASEVRTLQERDSEPPFVNAAPTPVVHDGPIPF